MIPMNLKKRMVLMSQLCLISNMIIALTGFMGCGKSSIGKIAASKYGCNLIDLDEWIEEDCGMSIGEIFGEKGEKAFREMEVNALKQIIGEIENNTLHSKGGNSGEESLDLEETVTILSLGGGTLTNSEAASLVREKTHCIYLRANTETLVRNLLEYPGDRPMLNGAQNDVNALRARINELMSKRQAIYETVAHRIIDIDDHSYDEIAEVMIHDLRQPR